MRTRQRGWGWIATGLLTAATLGIAVRPAGAQGFSGSSSGGGFTGSSGGGSSGSSGGGFTGSSGGGFSGSSSGSGFTWSSGSFSGSSGSFSGTSGSFSGSSTGSYTGTSRSTTGGSGTSVVPQASDPFQTYYANPYKYGMSTTTGTGTSKTSGQFGTPLYGNITTPKTTTGTTGAGSTASMSFNTVGMRRAPSFTTTLGFAPPVAAPPSALQTTLGTVYQGTSQLSPNSNIQVVVNGGTLVLRGRVANENERRVAEGMARLEPGVREVRNELTIAAPRAAGTP